MDEIAFSKTLFWDTDAEGIDFDKRKFYVIERVVTRGNYTDWKKMLALYNEEVIKSNVVKIKDLDPKTLNFCSFYFDIPKPAFECYTTPHWTEMQKFGEEKVFVLFKSITYFNDAENDENPSLTMGKVSWVQVKQDILKRVKLKKL